MTLPDLPDPPDLENAPAGVPALAVSVLHPLIRAEATAEAPTAAMEPGDLEQAVWVRLLERLGGDGPPRDAVRWIRTAVRAEARRARRTAARELPYSQVPVGEDRSAEPAVSPERAVLRSELGRALRAAVTRSPGNCPRLLAEMLSPADPTYREIAGTLGIAQGSLGPMRSRCLGCLRRMLAGEVGAREHGGKER